MVLSVGRHPFHILKNIHFACSMDLHGSKSSQGQTKNNRRAEENVNKTLRNSWQRATGKNYNTCKVQRVIKIQQSFLGEV